MELSRQAGWLGLAEASQSLDFGASTKLSSTPSAGSHRVGALLASLGSEYADHDDDASLLTNDMILDMVLSINNQEVEPSVVPGSYRSKQAPAQVEPAQGEDADAETSAVYLKAQEDQLKQARYRKQVGRGQAQLGFAEMREGLLRLRQQRDWKLWKEAM